jgi:hypothetical protein
MTDPMMKLQIMARAELALVQIRLERLIQRSALFVVAMVFALLGLGMFNLAIFFALSSTQGSARAALIVALINSAIMAIVLLVSLKLRSKQGEEKLAREIRDLAHTELNHDIEKVKAEISEIAADVRSIRASILAVPTAAANTLGPLLRLLLKSAKK